MGVRKPESSAAGTACFQARQLHVPVIGWPSQRLEQLARAHQAGRLLVDVRTDGAAGVLIDPRDVADAILARLGNALT